MKIVAYEVREDEAEIMKKLAGKGTGRIGALALDVFENENGIYHHDRKTDIIKNKDMAYFRQFPNVIMTQHMAFYTEQAVVSMVHCGLESLVAFAENKEYRCQLQ